MAGLREKILIIDDEKEFLDTINTFFASRGYAVTSALDGEEGLKMFDKENPDMVLCDIKMPRMDGFQFLKELRAKKKWIPVIIMTALSDITDVLKSYKFEADYYITKPVNLENALKAVKIMSSLIPLRKK